MLFLLFPVPYVILVSKGGLPLWLDTFNEMRKLSKMSLDELSLKSGVPKGTLTKITSGITRSPSLENMKSLVYAMGFSLKDLDDGLHATNLFSVEEQEHIKKYRVLDEHGKKMVDFILTEESNRMHAAQTALEPPAAAGPEPIYLYTLTEYMDPMSAGTGQPVGDGYGETLLLKKQPPRGTSYVAPIAGDSMEPTYHHGDRLFVQACYSINIGEVGVFLMGGQQWVKELGEGVLISHNPAYPPLPITDDIWCQGRVLGVCDKSYL